MLCHTRTWLSNNGLFFSEAQCCYLKDDMRLKPLLNGCYFFGTVFEFGDVFCFTDFLSGFLFRVRGRVRVKVGVGGGFRVRVRVSASVRAR